MCDLKSQKHEAQPCDDIIPEERPKHNAPVKHNAAVRPVQSSENERHEYIAVLYIGLAKPIRKGTQYASGGIMGS
jgi:hypothetical protein